MRALFLLAAMTALSGEALAQEWMTQTQDDVFTGKQTATMSGGFRTAMSVYATCQNNREFVLSVIFKMSDPSNVRSLDGLVVIKVDGGETHRMAVTSYSHNETYAGFATVPNDPAAIAAVKEIGTAKRKVVVGLDVPEIGNRQSVEISASGSTRAVQSLVKACEL